MLIIFAVSFVLIVGGCSTVSSKKEMESAVSVVAESLREEKTSAQYCPVCGKHYSLRVEQCPVDGNRLKKIEE